MDRPSDSFLIGYRSIEEALRSGPAARRLLVAGRGSRLDTFVKLAEGRGIPVERTTRQELRARAGGKARDCALESGAAPGSAAVSGGTGFQLEQLLAPPEVETSLLILLDHITDPHNYGAILRTADQFHADGVIVPDRRAATITPVVQQSSAGAAAHVRVSVVGNLRRAVDQIKDANYWVYGAAMDGERADSMDLSGRTAVVLGSEGSGLSRIVREHSDALVSIPAAGSADSFNVSVAAGILLYEIRRQQGWFDTL